MPQKRVPGCILEIDLGDGTRTFGLVDEFLSIALLDLRRPEDQDVSEADILAAPVLFALNVSDYALNKSGRWPIVGHIDLADKQLPVPIFYMYNSLKKVDPVTIIMGSPDQWRPGTLEEVRNLEPMITRDPEQAEERIRDHYAGVVNRYLKASKVTSGIWPRD